MIPFCVFCENMPLSLIYPGEIYGEISKDEQLVVIDTFKMYLDKSAKLESIVYSPEMPSVLLALKQNKLTAEECDLSASLSDKTKVGKYLGYDFLFLPEMKKNDGIFDITINVYNLKKGTMLSYSASIKSDGKNFLNDVNSAVSGICVQFFKDIFNEYPNFSMKEEKSKEEKAENEDTSGLNAKELAKIAEKEYKKENYTDAIVYITKAIDLSPDDPQLRLTLANAYYMKQMYKEALDQYYTAINLGYRGEDTYKLKQKFEARVRALDYVKPADVIKKENKTAKEDEEVIIAPPKVENPSNEYNRQIIEALSAGDSLWKSGKINDALKAYGDIARKYPKDYRAYERLVIVYANAKKFSESARTLKILNSRALDYSHSSVTARTNTLSAILSGYYMTEIRKFRNIKDNIMLYTSSKELKAELKEENDKIYESVDLVDAMGEMTESFYVTNLKLTGNLINSAVSSLIDYMDGDLDALDTADNSLKQAEIRIGQLKF